MLKHPEMGKRVKCLRLKQIKLSLLLVTPAFHPPMDTVILTFVSPMQQILCHCHSAAETRDLLIHHVFRLHGIPRDIVSERDPQFTYRVWRFFCPAFGALVSLSSGYHPQSNGQTERTNQSLESVLRCVMATHLYGAPACRELSTHTTSWCQLRLEC